MAWRPSAGTWQPIRWQCASSEDNHGSFDMENPKDFDRWDETCGHFVVPLFDPWRAHGVHEGGQRK